MTTAKEYQKAVEYLKGLDIDIIFESVKTNPNMEDSRDKFNFSIDFENIKTHKRVEVFFSQSHRVPHKHKGMTVHDYEQAERKLKKENVYPDLFGLLNCLTLDADCLDYDFEEWAANLGYDPDSRKAEKVYNTCKHETRRIKGILNLDAIREYLEENELN